MVVFGVVVQGKPRKYQLENIAGIDHEISESYLSNRRKSNFVVLSPRSERIVGTSVGLPRARHTEGRGVRRRRSGSDHGHIGKLGSWLLKFRIRLFRQ